MTMTWEELIKISRHYKAVLHQLLTEDSKWGLTRNIGLFISLIFVGVLLFFFVYLPATTNHGQILVVPDVEGMDVETAKNFLERRELGAVITDSIYTVLDSTAKDEQPGNIVLTQTPAPYSKVKLFRKINLVISSKYARQVEMPDILGTPLENARQRLYNKGLRFHRIRYVPNSNNDQVLKVFVDGQEYTNQHFKDGVYVYKNQQIDVHVSDGIGNNILKPLI